MASIKNIDIRKGMVITGEDGQLYECLERDLNTPGNWRAILQLKLRNLRTGSITENRVRPDDKVDLAYIETRDFQYSYREGTDYVFMDMESFETLTLPDSQVGEKMVFLRENDPCKVIFINGTPMTLQLPSSIEMKVIDTEPSIKGATAAAQYKPAILETGVKINVPSFVNIGEIIVVDTEEKKYLRRAKE